MRTHKSFVSVKFVSAGFEREFEEPSRPTCSSSQRHSALGALVAPDDRWPHDVAVLAEQHRAVHLAREPDRWDRRAIGLRLLDRAQRLLPRAPPVVRLLFRPCRTGRREGLVWRGSRCRDRAVRLHDDGARAARSHVDADDRNI